MIIRAQLSHLEEIVEIERHSFYKPWSKNQLKDDIQADGNSENWVYIKDKKILGYIFGWVIHDEYHLHNIAVDRGHYRKNIGTSLINHVIKKILLRNIKIILLEVSIYNMPARSCYESLGFVKVGKRMNYYSKGEDAILYNLEIN